MKDKFKCPVCGDEIGYGRQSIGYRRIDCYKCNTHIFFLRENYRQVKAKLFPAEKTCEWVDVGGFARYKTECGTYNMRTNDYPSIGKYTHCPYCGGRIVEEK